VVAWGLAQVADLVLDNTTAPDWVMQSILLILALGFPLAVILAWAFEVTPEGVRRAADATAAEASARLPAGDYLFIGLMLAVIAVVGYQLFVMQGPAADSSDPRTAASDSGERSSVNAEATTSIAVLPFVNMSMDAGNEYFADGISEELLNILAGIEGLKVASRTSAFSFKDSNAPIPEIAEQLDVRHVLEGSVRKQGNRVRITAQLIEAGEDAHLWSETYDRELDDIFAVQEEIAQAITGELAGILGTREVAVAAPTRDMDAYQLYLRGRSRFYGRFELNEAVEDLRAAVAEDSEFAEAWAFLAATYWLHGNGGYQTDYDRGQMSLLAGIAAERAMSLSPDIPIALAVQGQITVDSDEPDAVARGIRLLERAVELSTVDTTPKLWLALLWIELGQAERALPLLESARLTDPLVGINAGVAGTAHAVAGRFEQAEQLGKEAVELSGLTFWLDLVVANYTFSGEQERARELVEWMLVTLDEADEAMERNGVLPTQEALADPSSRERLFDAGAWARSDLMVASVMFDRGRRAFEIAPRDPNRPWGIVMAAWLPAIQWLREDPRFFEMMEQNGRVEYWESEGYPRGCRPVDGPEGRHLDCPDTTP